jgi:lysophospholipase L1-like esterase
MSIARWQVIHIHLGWEDMKRWARIGDGMQPYLDASAPPAVSPEEFADNLRQIVHKLKSTGAKLYWSPILPIPVKASGYHAGEEVEYNRMAHKVMEENGVYVNNLHAFVKNTWPDYTQGDTLEFSRQQYSKIGEQIASALRYLRE